MGNILHRNILHRKLTLLTLFLCHTFHLTLVTLASYYSEPDFRLLVLRTRT